MNMSKRIIFCNDGVNGHISEHEKNRATAINLNPVFEGEKPWKFIKVLKSTTKIVPWLIQIGEEYIVCTQGMIPRKTEMCMFYHSNKRGTYNILQDKITEYWRYVDMETACDKFYEEFYLEKELEKQIENEQTEQTQPQ